MQHFPVLLDLRGRRAVLARAGDWADRDPRARSWAAARVRRKKAEIEAILPVVLRRLVHARRTFGARPAGVGPTAPRIGFVHIVGAGPGDPELLTLRARRLLNAADVVIHDRLVPAAILDLARRGAEMVEVGKTPYGRAWAQEDINDLLVERARAGCAIVRLKGGDPALFARLDEEIEALEASGIGFAVTPGITAASASVAAIGQALTRRGRNAAVRLLTAHDVDGFTEHDWRDLARPGATAAVYMGLRAAAFLRGRLMMHGAAPDTPVTAVENASRADQRVIATSLVALPDALACAAPTGPVLILIGLAPRRAAAALSELKEAL